MTNLKRICLPYCELGTKNINSFCQPCYWNELMPDGKTTAFCRELGND